MILALRRGLIAVVAVLGLSGVELRAQVRCELQPQRAYVGQEVRYSVTVRNAMEATCALPAVEGLEFELLDQGITNQNSSVRMVNGRIVQERSSADYAILYSVKAKEPGRYEIPAPEVDVEGETRRGQSAVLVIEDPAAQDKAFLKAYCFPDKVVLGQEATLVVEIELKFLPEGAASRDPLYHYDRGQSFFGPSGTPPPVITLPWIAERPQGLGPIDLQTWVRSREAQRNKGFRLSGVRGGRFLETTTVRDVRRPDAAGRDADYRRYRFTLPIRGEVAGRYELPAVTLEGKLVEQQGRDLVWRDVFARSDPMRFEVLEPPREGRPESFSGAVGDFRFTMEPPAPTRLRVGDPVYVTFVAQGEGFLKGVGVEAVDALADEFRVEAVAVTDSLGPGEEPPPGFPDRPGRWRQWEFKLSPVAASVERIPELAFSWYDPDREEYRTARTDAVPLEVTEAAPGRGAVVSPDVGGRPGDVELVATSALSSDVSDLNLLADQRPRPLRALATLGGMAAVYAGLAFVVGRRRRREADPAMLRREKARGRARQRLREARACSGVEAMTRAHAALLGFVADVVGRDEDALTSQDLLEFAREGADEGTRSKLEKLCESVEAAAFGGGAESDVGALLDGVEKLLERKVGGRVKGRASPTSLALILPVLFAVPAAAQDVERFQLAQRASETGDWEQASLHYEAMLEDGYENGWVFYNLGNCRFREGRLGHAIAAYRRASLHLPGDANLEVNLRRALEARSRPLSRPDERAWFDYVLFWRSSLSFASELRWTLALAAFAFLVAVLRVLLRRPPKMLRWTSGLALVGALLLGVSATLDYRELTAWNHGVVTEDAIVLRSGPGESYDPSFEQRVDSGAEFVVLAERDDWVKALVGGKYEGWLSGEVVARW